jgi:sulfite reductase beta subunit-like hemoprotein
LLSYLLQGDGILFYGVHLENGRVTGDLKKALREVIETNDLSVRLTANQNIILCDIKPSWKAKINKILGAAGVQVRVILRICCISLVQARLYGIKCCLEALFTTASTWPRSFGKEFELD